MANKRFAFIYQSEGRTVGFNDMEQPHYITEPITKVFKGIAYTYLCTKDGIYSTNDLQLFEKEEGDI